jgi:hypothetical protein
VFGCDSFLQFAEAALLCAQAADSYYSAQKAFSDDEVVRF